jgi:hypothetical protein
VGANPFHAPRNLEPIARFEEALGLPVAVVYGLALLTLLLLMRSRPIAGPAGRAAGVRLLLLVAAGVMLADSISEAGLRRVNTMRQVLPIYFVAAAALALLVSLLSERRRWAGALVAGLVLVFNVAGYNYPWSPFRSYSRDLERRDRDLIAYLQGRGISWICGNYWVVYPFNFLTARRITGVPFRAGDDHYAYAKGLTDPSARWALVATDPKTIDRWLEQIPLAGNVGRVAGRYFVFLPSDAERARWGTPGLIGALRNAAPDGGY